MPACSRRIFSSRPSSCSALAALIRLLQEPAPHRAILLGLLVGLAAGSKYIGMLILPFAVIAILLVPTPGPERRWLRAATVTAHLDRHLSPPHAAGDQADRPLAAGREFRARAFGAEAMTCRCRSASPGACSISAKACGQVSARRSSPSASSALRRRSSRRGAADAASPDRELHPSVVRRPRGHAAQAVSRFFPLHAAARAAASSSSAPLSSTSCCRASIVAGSSRRSPSFSPPSRRYRCRCGSTLTTSIRATIIPPIVAASGARRCSIAIPTTS